MPTVKINGMRCGHCVASVSKALKEVPGIAEVSVDLDQGAATYNADAPIPAEVIKQAIEAIGFEVAD